MRVGKGLRRRTGVAAAMVPVGVIAARSVGCFGALIGCWTGRRFTLGRLLRRAWALLG